MANTWKYQTPFFYFLLFFFLAVLGFELSAYTLRHSTSPIFCDRVFQDREIGSHKLFAQAGFKPRSSWISAS
jgi:hypothetical protein